MKTVSRETEVIERTGLATAVASRLLENCTRDFSSFLIVVPSKEAGRLLRETLAQEIAEDGGGLVPPTILTPAGLANSGLHRFPVTNDLQASLAWVAVLQETRPETTTSLFPAPFVKDLAWCREFATALIDLRRTLGEAGLTFADVAATENVPERARWRALAQLEKTWITLLERQGLRDRESVRQAMALEASLARGYPKRFLL